VRPDDRLSPPTAREILLNNEGREAAACPYEPPPRPAAKRTTS
jgi:hypothetical protein